MPASTRISGKELSKQRAEAPFRRCKAAAQFDAVSRFEEQMNVIHHRLALK